MTIERRNYSRANLCVPIFLLPKDSTILIRTETQNLGADGFFCSTEYPFRPGDRVKFLFLLPSPAAQPQSTIWVCVHGEAEITRVSIGRTQASCGIECELRTYTVVRDFDLHSVEEAVAEILQSTWL